MISSITLQKYTFYVIITRRKPLLFSSFAKPNVALALQRQFFWTIWSINLCHTDMDYGKFVFRDFSAKQNIKNIFFFAI